MRRELTEQEIEASIIAWREQKRWAFTEAARDGVYPELHAFFDDGFRAGLDYQQAQPADPLREAAPELLAALKMCVEAATVYDTDELTPGQLAIRQAAMEAGMTPRDYVMSKARAAIARAEPEGRE